MLPLHERSPVTIARKVIGRLEARVGIELEPVCGRERSGSPQAKSRAKPRDLKRVGGAGRNRTDA